MSGYDKLSTLIFDLNQHTSALSTCHHHHEIPFQSPVDFRRTALPFNTDNSDNQLIKINQLWFKLTSPYKYWNNSMCCILKWTFQRMLNNVFIYLLFMCNEGSEACGSICNLALINLDRVKQAVINHQCQKYQRQGRDVNNTRQESGQAATQSELPGAISQGQAAENQRG